MSMNYLAGSYKRNVSREVALKSAVLLQSVEDREKNYFYPVESYPCRYHRSQFRHKLRNLLGRCSSSSKLAQVANILDSGIAE
jgi:hypothetical protein